RAGPRPDRGPRGPLVAVRRGDGDDRPGRDRRQHVDHGAPGGRDRARRGGRSGVTELHVLRVFVGPEGRGGNPLGGFLDGAAGPGDGRRAVARRLGFSETVFVDDPAEGAMGIFTPAAELAFAGHPTVGTGWLLRETGAPATTLRPPAGDCPVRHDAERT